MNAEVLDLQSVSGAKRLSILLIGLLFFYTIFQTERFELDLPVAKEKLESFGLGSKTEMAISPTTLDQAIRGEQDAVGRFVREFAPIIHVRIGRVLLRHKKGLTMSQVRQETEDLCQETFAQLFAHQARVLQSWDAHKGLSLTNFIGLIAERVAFSWFRTGRKNAWREMPMEGADLERKAEDSQGVESPESQVANRETLEQMFCRLKVELPPNGLQVFYLVYVKGKSVEEVSQIMNIKPDTVYSWRSRLKKRARAILQEINGQSGGGATRTAV